MVSPSTAVRGAEAPAPADPERLRALREVSQRFEATFLAQVLDLAGVAKAPEGWGGGPGEDAFRGHLLAEQGRLIAGAGGVGLAEHVFQALLKKEGLKP